MAQQSAELTGIKWTISIEALWSAKGGSPAADRLEVLSLLVERYLQEHFRFPTCFLQLRDRLSDVPL